ncbi:MAG: DegT/DnrJ/EryC1/StrS aminotransferase family protein [Planctomycetes bacterium]|nr:DegT/DnrJ/EryC1/StrS aminotransferase family protein [Planctomycetota bacterium]
MHLRSTVEPTWDQAALSTCLEVAAATPTESFVDRLRRFLRTDAPLWTYPSGRTALEAVLAKLTTTRRKRVLVCDLNCMVVPEAVVKAGGTVETYDLDGPNGQMDWGRIADQLTRNHAAIVVPHFFGVPTDFRTLLPHARDMGVFVIEDCALTLGATLAGQTAGTFGDAAIFSFNYDKPITLGGGGALLANNRELAARLDVQPSVPSLDRERTAMTAFLDFLDAQRSRIPPQAPWARGLRKIAETLMIRPRLAPPPCTGIGPLRSALGIWQLERYAATIAIRNRHAKLLEEWNPGRSWHRDHNVAAAWLRQKIVPRNPQLADAISLTLRRRGLRVGRLSWRRTVGSWLGEPSLPNASSIIKHSLDVPIHQEMTESEMELIQEELDRHG